MRLGLPTSVPGMKVFAAPELWLNCGPWLYRPAPPFRNHPWMTSARNERRGLMFHERAASRVLETRDITKY